MLRTRPSSSMVAAIKSLGGLPLLHFLSWSVVRSLLRTSLAGQQLLVVVNPFKGIRVNPAAEVDLAFLLQQPLGINK
jgi:hypothetical protein